MEVGEGSILNKADNPHLSYCNATWKSSGMDIMGCCIHAP